MTRTEKERLLQLIADSADSLDKTATYDAIALAERDEKDATARQHLHEAALALLRGHSDKAQALIEAIEEAA